MKPPMEHPDRIASYFRMEWVILLAVTLTGLFYNIGLLAGPWFEGRLAQCLLDVIQGTKGFADMLRLTAAYVAVITVVQLARYGKRFYVRRFANHVNRNMKQVLYGDLVRRSKAELDEADIGSIMTKAISDVDACVEGMRKFTTEIFDTGVALVGYIGLLLWYDWKLSVLCLLFPPISCILAEKMKTVIQKTGAAAQESRGRLSAAALDRVSGAAAYRVFGCETQRDGDYEKHLQDLEEKTRKAELWAAAMPPVYQSIAMVGVLFFFWLGGRNVVSHRWDIAAFTTFLSCFTKLSVKAAKAAKLFHAVQKAQVSWQRIKPWMQAVPADAPLETAESDVLSVEDLGVGTLFRNLTFTAKPGQIIGVTGPVACGKSTFGKAFLREFPYEGQIRFGDTELSSMDTAKHGAVVGYLGHDPELRSDTIEHNICWGDSLDPWPYLKAVCLDGEVKAIPEGLQTMVGNGGIRLSGGQQARLALARTLAHPRPLLILDDPFSALDRETERGVFEQVKQCTKDSIVILLSHRLYLFPELDSILWMENGTVTVGTHETLLADCDGYRSRFAWQEGRAQP